MPANSYGRQVVEALVNKSGGSVAAGDVVIIDTTNDGAFTTTTTARSEVTIGVAQETIASNATGRVLLSGYAALVNVPASVTRGHYVETHTVAKQATGSSTRRSGSFGQFRTGGATPTAVLWGNADQTATAVAASIEYLLSADVALNSSLAWFDGPSGTPTAGTYDLLGRVSFQKGAVSSDNWIARLLKGAATVLDLAAVDVNADSSAGSTNSAQVIVMAGGVVFDGSTAVKLQAAAFRTTPSIRKDILGTTDGSHRATMLRLTRIA